MESICLKVARKNYTLACILLGVLFLSLLVVSVIWGMRILTNNFGGSRIDEIALLCVCLVLDFFGGRSQAAVEQHFAQAHKCKEETD